MIISVGALQLLWPREGNVRWPREENGPGREGEHQQVRVGAGANLRQPHNTESDQDEGSVLLSLHLGL